MKKTTTLFLIAVFIITCPSASFGWGKKGHDIIAEIAFSFLDSSTKRSVLKYLDTTTIEQAANWMDDMRSDPKFNYMKPWHYVDIEKGSEYKETKDANIINALNKAISELEHKDTLSNEAIKTDLLIVFHLVGDLHMPLHVGYDVDKGGNTVHVKYLDHQKPTNLHKVWDTEIIESEKITDGDCLARLNTFNDTQIAELKKINIENWIREPRSLLDDDVYDLKDNTIDQAYVDKNKVIIENQLLIAGIRLSAVLEMAFKS